MSPQIPKNLDWYASFENLLGEGFLELITIEEKEILRIKPPSTLVFKPNVIQEIFNGLAQKVERGGILACRAIRDGMKKVLCVEEVLFIKNISRNPYHSYKPNELDWKRKIGKVLFEKQLLPVEFHSHPISRKKPDTKLFEYFCEMGASHPDQFFAKFIIQIGNYGIAVPQAILIRDVQMSPGFFIGIYGGLFAPKDFGPEIMKAGGEKAVEIGEYIAKWIKEQLSDPKKKEITKVMGIGSILAGLLFPQVALSLLGFLVVTGALSIWRLLPLAESLIGKEMPYFGIAGISETLRIKIPYCEVPNYSLSELQIVKLKEKELKTKTVAGNVK